MFCKYNERGKKLWLVLKMQTNHVTVVVPAFNTAKYIKPCLDSILKQSHKNTDIVVVNDGSTDDTGKIACAYMRKGHPVSVMNIHRNKGVTHATHVGIMSAQGPIVTIVDSDDMLLDGSLKYGIKPFMDPKVGFVWTKFVKSTGGIGWSRGLPEGVSLWRAMMYNKWWKASHQRFLRKSVYENGIRLNTSFDRSSDFQLVLLIALSGCKTIHVPVATYWYRMRRPNSLTSEGSEKQRVVVTGIRKWLQSEIKKRGINEPA